MKDYPAATVSFSGCLSVCLSVCSLTLSAAAADLPEHGPLTQPVESLLADQLQQLRLQALFQLSEGKKKKKENQLHINKTNTPEFSAEFFTIIMLALVFSDKLPRVSLAS